MATDQVQMKINRERYQKEKEEKERRDREKEEKERRDREEEERKKYDRVLREKREKIELEKKEKEQEEILLKKGVLKSFNSSHIINHSHFFNSIFTFTEFFKPISLPIVLNPSKDFAKSYFDLMLPTRFEITQSTPNYFSEVGLAYFQITFNNTTRPSSFVLYCRYTLAFQLDLSYEYGVHSTFNIF